MLKKKDAMSITLLTAGNTAAIEKPKILGS